MHPDTRQVADHMREFGMATLGRAANDLTFSQNMHGYASAMAIGAAGHGAEMVLKARIAQEHPLLLFATLPKSTTASGELTMTELFDYGRTVMFSELPELLWATTGIRMGRVEQDQKFGRMRNGTIHFALPVSGDWHGETLRFLFEVIEPLTHLFWHRSIALEALKWDEVALDGFLQELLKDAGAEIVPDLQTILNNGNPWP